MDYPRTLIPNLKVVSLLVNFRYHAFSQMQIRLSPVVNTSTLSGPKRDIFIITNYEFKPLTSPVIFKNAFCNVVSSTQERSLLTCACCEFNWKDYFCE